MTKTISQGCKQRLCTSIIAVRHGTKPSMSTKSFVAKRSGKVKWKFLICMGTQKPNALTHGVIWTVLMTNARDSLPCWKSRPSYLPKLLCGFKSSRILRNTTTSFENQGFFFLGIFGIKIFATTEMIIIKIPITGP